MRYPVRKTIPSVALLLVFSLASCGSPSNAPDDSDAAGGDAAPCEGERLVLAQSNPGLPRFPSYVADHAGYFEDTGLEVEFVETESGANAIAAVVGGSADIVPETFDSLLRARNEGADLVAFASYADEFISNVVVKRSVLEERGVSESSSPEEKAAVLQGLKIGITSPGSSTDSIARTILRGQGLNPDTDATIVPIGGSAMAAAFTQDRIDALVLSSPIADLAAEEGDGVVLFNLSQGEYEPLSGLLSVAAMATQSTIEDRPEALTCYTVAITRALQLIEDDPSAAAEAGYQEFEGVLDRDIFDIGLDGSIGAYSSSPVITEESAQSVIEVINELSPEPLNVEVEETFNTDIAEAAVDAMEAGN